MKAAFILVIVGFLQLAAGLYLLDYSYDLDAYAQSLDAQAQGLSTLKASSEMLVFSHTFNGSVMGVYNPSGDFYCVVLNNRSVDEIDRTDTHESCHALIAHDVKAHFCKEAFI